VLNVAQTDRTRGSDFPYTAAELRQIARAVRNEGYPPQGRTGVGTVVRRHL
jgi:hypothetical protein